MSSYTTQPLPDRRKRVRFSGDHSSERSMSDESALVSTSVGEQSTDASDCNSNSESDLSESSEEPSDDSSSEDESDETDTEMQEDGQDEVVNLRANRGKKPNMRLNQEELGPDIRTFLKDFLPQLKAANEELVAQKKAGTLKSLDATEGEDGEPYIEMDLGLGVLEEKDPNADSSSESEASDTEDGKTDKSVLDKLLGSEKTKGEVGIEVVQDTHDAEANR